jgi:hypothetical protein
MAAVVLVFGCFRNQGLSTASIGHVDTDCLWYMVLLIKANAYYAVYILHIN